MNFFEAQQQARRGTWWLILLVITTYIIVGFLLYCVAFYGNYLWEEEELPAHLMLSENLLIGVSVLMLYLVFAAWLRSRYLAKGAIHDLLHGSLVHSTDSAPERVRLFNVVDEMAVASGVPRPQVYVIPDNSINAFAAGTTINNATIGVTQGALDHFTRAELQAVIAHEFSHILNGDMLINMRMTGAIFGLSALSHAGASAFSLGSGIATGFQRGNSEGIGGGLFFIGLLYLLIGLVLLVLGSIGEFFASIIRMAMSRQREFLADASAVQFTRSTAIAYALYRIAAIGERNNLFKSIEAVEFANLYFSDGVGGALHRIFATHPPVKARILRVLPTWDGVTPLVSLPDLPPAPPTPRRPLRINSPAQASALVGQVGTMHLPSSPPAPPAPASTDTTSAAPIAPTDALPPPVSWALECSYSARALLYAIVIEQKDEGIAAEQLAHLKRHADEGVYDLTLKVLPTVTAMTSRQKLTMIEEAIEPMRTMSLSQYDLFLRNLFHLVELDTVMSLLDWSLQAIVLHSLNDTYYPHHKKPKATKQDLSYAVLMLLQQADQDAQSALLKIGTALSLPLKYMPATFDGQRLFAVMSRLVHLSPAKKQKLLEALTMAVGYNDSINHDEEVLLRAYFAMLDCPLPMDLQDLTIN